MNEVLDYIKVGRDKAVGRHFLKEMLSISDRSIRKDIEIARQTVPILNLSDGNGYFIPDKENETDMALLNVYIQQEENRIKAIKKSIERAKEMRDSAKGGELNKQ